MAAEVKLIKLSNNERTEFFVFIILPKFTRIHHTLHMNNKRTTTTTTAPTIERVNNWIPKLLFIIFVSYTSDKNYLWAKSLLNVIVRICIDNAGMTVKRYRVVLGSCVHSIPIVCWKFKTKILCEARDGWWFIILYAAQLYKSMGTKANN